MERMLRRLVGEDIEMSLFTEHSVVKVLADPGQVEQVVMNLVVNARDAMPDVGSIVIGTENVELGASAVGALAAGSYVKVSVKDSGTGMPQEVASRAFEPFFTTKEAGKGTGLGLSQVYGFITQSGGNVLINSSVGNGTTIDIYLPAATGNTES
jgi:signal transduction histidine kinase